MGKYLALLRENQLEFNQSEKDKSPYFFEDRTDETKKTPHSYSHSPSKPSKPPVSRSEQPDARELAREVTAARRGQWLTPTPALLALWRAFEAHFGHRITSQQIGGIGAMVDANSQINNDEAMVAIGAFLRQGESR